MLARFVWIWAWSASWWLFVPCQCHGATPAELNCDEIMAVRAVTNGLANSSIGLPRDIIGSKQVLVIVTATGGRTTITAVNPVLPADRLADHLYAAVREAGFRVGSPARDDVDSYSVASVTLRRAHYRAAKAINRVPIAKIGDAFRNTGLATYVLLRVPRYARCAALHLPTEVYPKNTWYNATKVPPGSAATIYTDVPSGAPFLVFYLDYLLPALGVCSIAAGFAVGLTRKLSPKKIIAWFDRLALLTPLMAAMASGLTAGALHRSKLAECIADGWIGGSYSISRTLICAGVLFVLLVPILALRGRVLRGLDDEPDAPDIADLQRRGRRMAITAMVIILICGFYLALARAFAFESGYLISMLGPMMPAIVAPLLTRHVMLDLFLPNKRNDDLTERACRLAPVFGANVREVMVATGKEARKTVNAVALPTKRRIIVTQNAVEVLSPREMDWLLAHELAHFSDNRVYSGLRLTTIASWLGVAATYVVIGFGTFGCSPAAIFLVGMLPVLGILNVSYFYDIRRGLEYEADIQAMVTVGDLDSAISGLLALRGQNGKLSDVELDEHPKLVKRLGALRAVAKSLGIVEQGAGAVDEAGESVAKGVLS